MARIESGRTDQYVYFVAVDATDLKTRETGLSSFTVVRSRNGAADATYTTPTVTEIDNTTMPGVYALLVDEDTTITTGSLTEQIALHITHAGMNPVTLTVELFRELGVSGLKTAQGAAAGTLTLESGGIGADDQKLGTGFLIEDSTSATGAIGQLRSAVDSVNSTDVVTLDRNFDTTPSGTIKYREIAGSLGPTTTEVATAANSAVEAGQVGTDATAILADTNELQTDWVNGGRLDLILDAILADTGTDGVVLSAATQAAIADALLNRDMSTGTDSGSTTVRTVRQALRALRNRVAESAGTVTVYKEDDSTASWTTAITGTPAVTESNPAGP